MIDDQDAIDAVNRELEKLFPGQVVYGPAQETWTVSGAPVDESGIDRIDIADAVNAVNDHLKGWHLYRPGSKGNVYRLEKDERPPGPRQFGQ